ncbi:MAG: RrF2 family transcriptional regulator [Chloroflexota bacterium]
MKISKRTRYGFRLMVELARNFNKGPVSLREIARKEKISQKYLEQIIIQLKTVGPVMSVRGAQGGYVLSVPPSQISLKSLFDILEGSSGIVECAKRSSACNRVDDCAARKLWVLLEERVGETLSSMTLQDLTASDVEASNVLDFTINGRKRVSAQSQTRC